MAKPEAARSAAAGAAITFAEAVPKFLDYLGSYRSYSPATVDAYARDLELFQEFLRSGSGALPHPGDVARETVVQFAVSLSGKAPFTVRRKLACLSVPR